MRSVCRLRPLSLVGLILALISPGSGGAGDDPARPPAPIHLFDGRTLEGWKPVVGPRNGTVTAVDGGAIALAGGGPITEHHLHPR